MQITEQEMNQLPFELFHKTNLIMARPLTEEDYKQRVGFVRSLEGPIGFQPGDYLAHGTQGEEWPIQEGEFKANYQQVTEPDTEGFAMFHHTDVRHAVQISESFTVKMKNGDIATGKAGDYLVKSGDSAWIVDCTIFEGSYERMS